ncbi:MAG: fimbrillin family protein [Bacteroidales bacterium]|nr:fimbrillin family protein [Bacteroidales bacterium]
MKKRFHILLPVLTAALFVSCQQSQFNSSSSSTKINIVVSDSEMTKASTSSEEILFSVPFEDENGGSFVLNAYVSDNCSGPQTKGVIATSENIRERDGYSSFLTTVFRDGETYVDEEGQSMSAVTVKYEESASEQSWTFLGSTKDAYYWPDDGGKLTFCSYAPTSITTPVWDPEYGTASFSYELPDPDDSAPYSDASNQPDLLFACDADQTKDSDGGCANIHFQHALVGLRFTRGANLNDCHIEDVTLENFYSEGTASFNVNNTPKFTWSDQAEIKTYRQTFDVDVDSDIDRASGDTASGETLDPTSTGEYTFLMIPQVLPDNAKISVSVTGRIHPIELAIGSPDTGDTTNDALLKDWSGYAGKIITLRVESTKMDLVRIEVSDEVTGMTKSDVEIKNVGTDGVFLRVALIANVVSADGVIEAPVSIDDIQGDSDFVKNANWANYWYYNSADGFYYYKYVLPSRTRTTCDIFESYTAPDELLTRDGQKVSFDIVTQAIDAGKDAASYTTDFLTNAGWPTGIGISATASGITY